MQTSCRDVYNNAVNKINGEDRGRRKGRKEDEGMEGGGDRAGRENKRDDQ